MLHSIPFQAIASLVRSNSAIATPELEIAEGKLLNKEESPLDDIRKNKKTRRSKSKNFVAIDDVLGLLKLCFELHGEVYVKPSYTVPASDPWPSKFHGYALGLHAKELRKQYAEGTMALDLQNRLNALGFVWEHKTYREMKLIMAITMYKADFGHVDVPFGWCVPADPKWPKMLWNYKLGDKCSMIRSYGRYGELRPELEALGFRFESSAPRFSPFEDIFKSLKVFRKLSKQDHVPKTYKIPNNHPSYPPSMYGVSLGSIYYNIIYRDAYYEHHPAIARLGYDFDRVMQSRYKKIQEAVTCYKKGLGDGVERFAIPHNYKVPNDSPNYPSHLWKFQLGKALLSLRQDSRNPSYPSMIAGLQSLGLEIQQSLEEEEKIELSNILKAARCFRRVRPHGEKLSTSFVVPNMKPYPPRTWGLELGRKMHEILHKGRFHQHVKKFEKLGFKPTLGKKPKKVVRKRTASAPPAIISGSEGKADVDLIAASSEVVHIEREAKC